MAIGRAGHVIVLPIHADHDAMRELTIIRARVGGGGNQDECPNDHCSHDPIAYRYSLQRYDLLLFLWGLPLGMPAPRLA